jgi:hypothetical protein
VALGVVNSLDGRSMVGLPVPEPDPVAPPAPAPAPAPELPPDPLAWAIWLAQEMSPPALAGAASRRRAPAAADNMYALETLRFVIASPFGY